MDADTLRAILDAQAIAQQKTLDTLMDKMEKMFKTMATAPAGTRASTTEFVTNSLSARLPEFTYDPENGCTFDKPAEVSVQDTVKTLQELFGHNTSVFARRYTYLRTQCSGETLRDYTGLVNRRHEMAEFNTITAEQMKCLVWICGLSASDYADLRAHALRKMEENPHLTLKELSAGIQQILDIRQDAKLLSSPLSPPTLPDVNAVNATRNRAKEPPSPCFRCGGLHWAKDCEYLEKSCHSCKRIGHKKGFCRNFNKRRNRNTKKKPRRANQVVVVASTATSAAPVKRIYRTVKINGTPTRMRLDTGADVTLLNLKDWITIGRPKLLPPLFALRSADNKEIKVRGHFQCNFSIEGHEGRGNCHVADTTSLLGLDWITQVEPLFHQLTGNATCNACDNQWHSSVSATTLAKLRSSLTTQLQKQFATVFAPGLGRCTKSKASLKLKPDATPTEFANLGGETREHEEVLEYHEKPDGMTVVKSSKTEFLTKKVVFTVGPWIKQLFPNLPLHVQPESIAVCYWSATQAEDSAMLECDKFPVFITSDDNSKRFEAYGLPSLDYPGCVKNLMEIPQHDKVEELIEISLELKYLQNAALQQSSHSFSVEAALTTLREVNDLGHEKKCLGVLKAG
ncbi:hypothetical protein TELCIR_00316 [Teladorsagia circumcincta]|uniref:Peptidase A2 domain-containing protein n=1 Tax=Teladorsagia circumcincta TaxID=45464 RepID=A0A2G9V4Y7_TELCI|nr:hypothetical protein TELCIR_00316 [Teladorsagia circumcincta]